MKSHRLVLRYFVVLTLFALASTLLPEQNNGGDPRPPPKSLIDHVDHIAKVAGINHVGLGSDFDGVSGATPAGIDSAADPPKITRALLDRGYSTEDIHKILGGNLLRVFSEVEKSRPPTSARNNK